MTELLGYHRQPLKAAYLTGQALLTLLVRMPFWIVASLPRPWRPRTSWTFWQSVVVKFARRAAKTIAIVGDIDPRGLPDYEAIVPGEGVNGVWLDPVPDLIVDELEIWATAQGVGPVRIPGYWMHGPDSQTSIGASPQPGEKVLLYLHGGYYKTFSAHPGDITAVIPRILLEHSTPILQRALSVEYRLSSLAPSPERQPFPAALLDALAGYAYLVNTVGVAPENIIVGGDSAGGNLAYALTRYLLEHGGRRGIPRPPGHLLLLSPWADLGSAIRFKPDGSWQRFGSAEAADILDPRVLADHCARAFAGSVGTLMLELNRYVSPASLHPARGRVSFEGFPRTFISAGGCESLLDEIRILRDRMVADMGESAVTCREVPDAVHDFLIVPGWRAASKETARVIAQWLAA
ncbi:alpha/beta-hydrolase [Schizophyllum commune H4-8]|uniref:Alpha/beta hydrolase fold-3 domain-containing protein n=1 Tax=Schizophyllum commune (strain H4-8 / FGSC 9210) TaxID=578458 RepID=D8Q7A4_SCHCM|nr:alpha/beta-hydrolase [Schizophyllum commune H4-8]KAI5891578.1 alpha/beta-hydrolase [Schizophyllum commune H4-8]